MNTKKANLFLVGAMKAGTTSFVDFAAGHKEVFVPPIKEPNFFISEIPASLYEPSRYFNLNTYFKKSFPSPLYIAKIESIAQYEKLFSLAQNQIYRIDASSIYLHSPETANKIKEYNSDAKIIIVLRDPIDRAYSHYRMDLGLGRTYSSFESIMKKQVNKYHSGELTFDTYLGLSCYDTAVERYQKIFENEVLVINFFDLINNTTTTFIKIADFLKISPFKNERLQNKNQSSHLRAQKLIYIFKRVGLKDHFTRYTNPKIRKTLFKLISTTKEDNTCLTPKTTVSLNEIFEKESSLFEQINK